MALRGDYLTLRVQQHSSGTVNEIVAESTSVSVDFSADALETTSQSDGLNASFIAGKVAGTASGDYLLASDGTNFSLLFAHMNNGDKIEVVIYRSGAVWVSCDGVLTSLSMGGGTSGDLVTGSYALQLSGSITVA